MRVTRYCVVLLGCVLSLVVFAESAESAVTVTGKVLKLPNHRPAVGYPVIMYPDSVTAMTDSEGRYTIEADALGELLVVKNDDEHIPCALKPVSTLLFVESSPGNFYMRPIELPFTSDKVKPKLWKTSGMVTDLSSLGAFDPPCRLASGLVKMEVKVTILVDEMGEFQRAKDWEIVWTAGKHPEESEIEQLIEKVVSRFDEVEFTPDTDEFCKPKPAEIDVPVRLRYRSGDGWTFVSRLGR